MKKSKLLIEKLKFVIKGYLANTLHLFPDFYHKLNLLSKFISVQLIVQLINLFVGILIIRKLSKQEYAYFTIANTLQATMSLLADIGIGTSLGALGGKIWQDKYRFGQLINTAINLRYYLAMFSVVIVLPILTWMLMSNGVSIGYTALITIFVFLGLIFQLTNTILIVIPRLHSQIRRIQNLDLFASVARLILTCIAYVTVLNTAIAIAISSIAFGLQRLYLGKWAVESIDRKAPVSNEDRDFTISNIKKSLPSTIFFCFQGQLSVFLISIFGTTTNIAEIGALGRISIIFVLISSVMSSIILPAFSRCQSYKLLVSRYFQILILFTIFGSLLIISCLLIPDKILFVLGDKYSNLKNELFLMMAVTVVNQLGGTMSSLNLSKAWIDYVWIEIPLRLIVQVLLLLVLDISTIRGVLYLNLFSSLSPIAVNAFLTYRGLKDYKIANSY